MIDDAIGKLRMLLEGGIPDEIDADALSGDDRELALLLNRLFSYVEEIQAFIVPLSRGDLDAVRPPRPSNFLSSPFKELHSRLLHLTWQAEEVAAGDYGQRVDFMGDFARAFNHMVVSLDEKEKALKAKIELLEEAVSRIATLEGILPICASCKRVRVPGAEPGQLDSWVEIERYISRKTEATFSHGICPECEQKLYAHLRKPKGDG